MNKIKEILDQALIDIMKAFEECIPKEEDIDSRAGITINLNSTDYRMGVNRTIAEIRKNLTERR